ncbi:MAG: hypothetical protein ACJAUD_001202 [Crocinitomicaceae bacterium]|jgi:hypothetical protein
MKQDLTFTFKTVATQEAADDMVQALATDGIPSKIRKEEYNMLPAYGGASVTSNYDIIIRTEDKTKAEEIVTKIAAEFLSNIDPEHYLFSYTDEELLDILAHRHDWNEIDLLLSEKILNDRGVSIDPQKIVVANEKRFEELAIPKKAAEGWIIGGYLFALLGGLIGLSIAYFVIIAKRKLPDGSKVYYYSESTRLHAKIIFALSLIVISSLLILQLSNGAI